MPEYLAPGVYVVEIDDTAKPIEGVPVTIDDVTLRPLVEDLRTRLASLAPDWTERNQGDPGVALLEVLAWLGEQLIYRADAIPDRAAVHTSRLAAVTLALLADKKPAQCGVLKGVRFFRGRSGLGIELGHPAGG